MSKDTEDGQSQVPEVNALTDTVEKLSQSVKTVNTDIGKVEKSIEKNTTALKELTARTLKALEDNNEKIGEKLNSTLKGLTEKLIETVATTSAQTASREASQDKNIAALIEVIQVDRQNLLSALKKLQETKFTETEKAKEPPAFLKLLKSTIGESPLTEEPEKSADGKKSTEEKTESNLSKGANLLPEVKVLDKGDLQPVINSNVRIADIDERVLEQLKKVIGGSGGEKSDKKDKKTAGELFGYNKEVKKQLGPLLKRLDTFLEKPKKEKEKIERPKLKLKGELPKPPSEAPNVQTEIPLGDQPGTPTKPPSKYSLDPVTKKIIPVAQPKPPKKSLFSTITEDFKRQFPGPAKTENVAKTISPVSKVVAKKIPLIGVGAGTLFALNKLVKGDPAGAGLEFVSGVLGSVPGPGTIGSFAVDAAIAAREAEEEQNKMYEKLSSKLPQAAAGGIFEGAKSGYNVRLHGKEAVVPLNNVKAKPAINAPEPESKVKAESGVKVAELDEGQKVKATEAINVKPNTSSTINVVAKVPEIPPQEIIATLPPDFIDSIKKLIQTIPVVKENTESSVAGISNTNTSSTVINMHSGTGEDINSSRNKTDKKLNYYRTLA